MWRTTLELTRCTLMHAASKWASSHTQTVFGARAEPARALARRMTAQTPALEVLLDEFETRGLRLAREAEPVRLQHGALSLALRGPARDEPLFVELFTRMRALLEPIPPCIENIDEDAFLGAVERMHQLGLASPDDADVSRWLSVADAATSGRGIQLEDDLCPCGAPAAITVDVTSRFVQNEESWEFTYTHLCLAEPHLHDQKR